MSMEGRKRMTLDALKLKDKLLQCVECGADFLFSVGEGTACDVRVSSKGAFLSALALALHHFLETQSEMAS